MSLSSAGRVSALILARGLDGVADNLRFRLDMIDQKVNRASVLLAVANLGNRDDAQ